jgi:uncharacterized protein (DUF2147 family)
MRAARLAPLSDRIETMPRFLRSALAILVLATGLTLGQTTAFAQDPASPFGLWRNPKGSVHVEVKPCGDGACGYVVWASDKAKEKASKAGAPELIGLQLFRELTPDESGAWKGKVYVPDLNRTFTGRAKPLDDQTLKAQGCLVAGVLCKSQIWTRMG